MLNEVLQGSREIGPAERWRAFDGVAKYRKESLHYLAIPILSIIEVYPFVLEHSQNILLGHKALMSVELLAIHAVEYLRRDKSDTIVLTRAGILPNVDELNLKPAGVFLLQFFQNRSHHLARNTLICAQINEARESGLNLSFRRCSRPRLSGLR